MAQRQLDHLGVVVHGLADHEIDVAAAQRRIASTNVARETDSSISRKRSWVAATSGGRYAPSVLQTKPHPDPAEGVASRGAGARAQPIGRSQHVARILEHASASVGERGPSGRADEQLDAELVLERPHPATHLGL